MKKLLLLGGSRYLLPVIKIAHELGIYVITCDYLPDNFAHKYADEYKNVSIVEKEAVLEIAKELKIDGIMSFACDPGVVTAAYVADQMGLPNCGPYKSVCILQNKGLFRDFLKKHEFNVPNAKSYVSIEQALSEAKSLSLPVIVKPTDSAGSKGVTKVSSFDQLEDSINYALKYSFKKEFIIEEFIEKRGYSSDSEGFSVNGELKFISFSSQRFDEQAENPYTPAAFSWPSSISEKNQEVLTSELQRLLTLLDMKTSIYNIEVREGLDGKPYIMEVSPRGGGNRLAEMLRYATGVDLIKNAVRAAVGEKTEDIAQREYDGCWAEMVLHSNQAGYFEGLWISEEIRENIIEEDIWITPGKLVNPFSAANESLGTVVLRFETEERLQEIMSNQNEYIKVVLYE